MTISTTTSKISVVGNGVTTAFTFPFVGVNEDDIRVWYTDQDGLSEIVSPSLYDIVLNDPAVGTLWGVGGTVTYPTSGPAIATGTEITIERVVPYTQTISIANQGAFYPQAVEQALDLLETQIQQLKTFSDHSIRGPITDVDAFTVLPGATDRAGYYLKFNGSGQPTVAEPPSPFPAVSGGSFRTLALAKAATVDSDSVNTVICVESFDEPVGGEVDFGGGFFYITNIDPDSDNLVSFDMDTDGFYLIRLRLDNNYYLNWAGPPSGGDDHDLLEDAIAAVPDGYNLCIIGNPTYLLGSTLEIKNRVGFSLIGFQGIRAADDHNSEMPIIQWTGTSGHTMFRIMGCGFCTFKGLRIPAGTQGSVFSLVNGGTGVTRISTQNTITGNLIENGNNNNFIAVNIAGDTDDTGNNNELHEVSQNMINCSAQKGIGLFIGNSTNAHGHIINNNTFIQLNYGIFADWLGFRECIGNNFNQNVVDITWGHVNYPTNIQGMDSEGSKQIFVTGACESSVVISDSRLVGQYNVQAGKGCIEIGSSGGPLIFRNNILGGGNQLNLASYLFDFTAAATYFYLIGNTYDIRFTNSSELTTDQILHNWKQTSSPNFLVVENDAAIRADGGGFLYYPYLVGRWQSWDTTSNTQLNRVSSSGLGALGTTTENGSTTSTITSGNLTVTMGLMKVSGGGNLTNVIVPTAFYSNAGWVFVQPTNANISVKGTGNILLPAGATNVAFNTGTFNVLGWVKDAGGNVTAYPCTAPVVT